MARLAIINEKGVVENLIVGERAEFLNSVDLDAVGQTPNIGDVWNGQAFMSAEPEPPSRIIPRQDFIDRFEFAELAALKALTRQPSQEGIEADVFWAQVTSRDTIDLDSELAQAAKLALQGWGIIDSARAAVIFA